MRPPTRQQGKALRFVDRFLRQNGFPPTLQEIGGAIGLANINAVRGHVLGLEKKGYITRVPDKARSIRIVRSASVLSHLRRKVHEILHTDEGVVHQVIYGMAWITRGRTPCFRGPLRLALRETFDREVIEHGWQLLACRIEPDHVVLVVKTWPNHSPELVVRRFKAAAQAMLRRQGQPARRPAGGEVGDSGLWARGYAVTTDLTQLDALVDELLRSKEEGKQGL